MAITRTQKDALADVEIVTEDTQSGSQKSPKSSKQTVATNESTKNKTKKIGFFASTLIELKQVEWPTVRYILNWSFAIILFTIVLSLILGFADHVFGAGISYANCTTPNSAEGKTIQDCNNDLLAKLTFRN